MMRRGAGRLPAYLLPALAVLALAVAAGLMWLLPADPALAQDGAKGPKIAAGPAIASSPASGDTYRAGEAITITLTFSKPVTVTKKPRLRLRIGDEKRWAGYESASADGATLSFTHTVKADDADADGISIGRNELKLRGGTIADADGNAARLKHPPLRRQAGHKVNGAPDEPEPPQPEPEPTATPTPQPQPQREANNEPQFPAATASRSVNENTAAGTSVGAAVTATDGDGDTLTYALTGADAGSFNLDAASGQVTVKAALDYEARASYTVSVTVHDGKDTAGEADASEDDTIAVTITVLNVDEAGVVSLLTENNAPEVDREISAVLLDPDGGVTGVAWTWQRSADAGAWSAIAGAVQDSYTIAGDDADHYLRAMASYADGEGTGKTAQAQTTAKVAAVVTANPVPAQPQNTPKPVSPRRYTVTPGDGVAALHWTLHWYDDTLARWQYRYKAGGGEYVAWRNIPGSSKDSWNYTVPGLTNGTAHTIQIRSVSKKGVFGLPSEKRTVTPYALTAPTAQTVPANWGLIPEGVGPGDSFRLMFITYDRTKAESTHVDTYNDFVQAQAAKTGGAGIPPAAVSRAELRSFSGEFRALMSTATVDARDNTATTGKGVPIYWVRDGNVGDGDKVADDYADFYDGNWDSSGKGYTQRGQKTVPSDNPHYSLHDEIWTGSNNDGTKHTYRFASGFHQRVNYGSALDHMPRVGASWDDRDTTNALYAISPVLTVALANKAPLKQIEVGPNHACALDRSGRVTCWGDDSSGQVSDWGRQRYQSQRFASISAGSFLTCGILANGSVSCWGYPEKENGSHAESANEDWTTWTARMTQTGYTGWVNTPPASVKFKPESLSVGNYHACAIQTTGELSCWGKAGDNRLVIPTVTTENNNEVIKKDGSGSKITDWTMVEAGFANACGIRQNGSVVCFGRATYERSAGPSGSGPFVDVTLGVYNGCALAKDGSVECWGSDHPGLAVLDPLKTPPTGVAFANIEMGTEQTYFYACGLQTDGEISCWGLSTPKQLTPLAGTWSSISVGSGSACALNREGYLGCWGESDEGLFSPPSGAFKQTDGGNLFSCAIKTDGELVCWGVNRGQTVSETPSAGTFKQVAVGASHACAIKSDDTVACWGGLSQSQRSPNAVAPGGTYQAISAGPDLTCAIVKASDTTDGSLHCWGATTHDRQTEPDGSFTHVAVGATHACAIKSDKTVACWGQALFFDREGDGKPDDIHGKGHHTSTIPPSGSHQYIDISAGENHTCALRSDKKAVCWGYHADRRQAVPGSAGSDDGFGVHNYIDIATGGLPNCAIRENDGSLSCWNNEKRQYLPDASVHAMRGFQSLGAGRFHMCGINSASSLVCWGAGNVIPFPARFAPP